MDDDENTVLIAMIGDSVASGSPYTNSMPSEAEDTHSWTQSIRNAYDDVRVFNRAIGGNTLENEVARAEQDVLNYCKSTAGRYPDICIIEGGGNDCWTPRKDNFNEAITAFKNMVQGCLRLGIIPVVGAYFGLSKLWCEKVVSANHWLEDSWGGHDKAVSGVLSNMKKLYSKIKSYSERRGLVFCDFAQPWWSCTNPDDDVWDDLNSDYVHPTDSGYERAGELWVSAMASPIRKAEAALKAAKEKKDSGAGHDSGSGSGHNPGGNPWTGGGSGKGTERSTKYYENPSTYFESVNNEGVFQFGDNTHLLHIVKQEDVVACVDEGQVYGVEFPDGVVGVSYSTTDGTLYISPIAEYNGKQVQYVTCTTDRDISIFYWSQDYYPPMEHGAGLELRDAEGNVVFNNTGLLGSFKDSFYSNVITTQGTIDVPEAPHWHYKARIWKTFRHLTFGVGGIGWDIEEEDRLTDVEGNSTFTTTLPGFANLYLALSATVFGAYQVYSIRVSHSKHHKHTYVNASETGYHFGKMDYPDLDLHGNKGKVMSAVSDGNIEQKDAAYFSYLEDNGYKVLRWITYPKRETASKKDVEDLIYGTVDDECLAEAEQIRTIKVGRRLQYRKPGRLKTLVGDKSQVDCSNSWYTTVSPSCSIMCPLTIWMPALIADVSEKNICYAYGYSFKRTKDGIRIKMETQIEQLQFKKLSGGGSLDQLNHIVLSYTRDGDVVNKDGVPDPDYEKKYTAWLKRAEKWQAIPGNGGYYTGDKYHRVWHRGKSYDAVEAPPSEWIKPPTKTRKRVPACMTDGVSSDLSLVFIVDTF